MAWEEVKAVDKWRIFIVFTDHDGEQGVSRGGCVLHQFRLFQRTDFAASADVVDLMFACIKWLVRA